MASELLEGLFGAFTLPGMYVFLREIKIYFFCVPFFREIKFKIFL